MCEGTYNTKPKKILSSEKGFVEKRGKAPASWSRRYFKANSSQFLKTVKASRMAGIALQY